MMKVRRMYQPWPWITCLSICLLVQLLKCFVEGPKTRKSSLCPNSQGACMFDMYLELAEMRLASQSLWGSDAAVLNICCSNLSASACCETTRTQGPSVLYSGPRKF